VPLSEVERLALLFRLGFRDPGDVAGVGRRYLGPRKSDRTLR
jgi:hypothetical protein